VFRVKDGEPPACDPKLLHSQRSNSINFARHLGSSRGILKMSSDTIVGSAWVLSTQRSRRLSRARLLEAALVPNVTQVYGCLEHRYDLWCTRSEEQHINRISHFMTHRCALSENARKSARELPHASTMPMLEDILANAVYTMKTTHSHFYFRRGD